MTDIIDRYTLYLIKQYWEKPKARAEIEAMMQGWQDSGDFIRQFGEIFDIDNAEDEVLDLIGRIVDLNRRVPEVVLKSYFGFSINPNAKGFADRFDPTREGAPFLDKFSPPYTDYDLSNEEYRKFLKVKIAKNNCSPYLASDEKPSLQQVVFDAFDGGAYVIDNKDQSLTLFVSPDVDEQQIRIVLALDLLPRPITFNYKIIISASPLNTFGFSNNPNAKGFADKFDPSRDGGTMARKLLNV
ncbi:coil containing protein [Vibrio phage 1.052.A._10N.286.46.C3]|nr:coil containing protein [Vibrio phage 1.052.A._10N.286.46.C3]